MKLSCHHLQIRRVLGWRPPCRPTDTLLHHSNDDGLRAGQWSYQQHSGPTCHIVLHCALRLARFARSERSNSVTVYTSHAVIADSRASEHTRMRRETDKAWVLRAHEYVTSIMCLPCGPYRSVFGRLHFCQQPQRTASQKDARRRSESIFVHAQSPIRRYAKIDKAPNHYQHARALQTNRDPRSGESLSLFILWCMHRQYWLGPSCCWWIRRLIYEGLLHLSRVEAPLLERPLSQVVNIQNLTIVEVG